MQNERLQIGEELYGLFKDDAAFRRHKAGLRMLPRTAETVEKYLSMAALEYSGLLSQSPRLYMAAVSKIKAQSPPKDSKMSPWRKIAKWKKLPEYPAILRLDERTFQKIYQHLSLVDQEHDSTA
ncbi:hypothetical protein GB937_007463 [Aspergillus fischeri]|nr:hypothetical protein GB937_007463 [Aspergillus fischeri]